MRGRERETGERKRGTEKGKERKKESKKNKNKRRRKRERKRKRRGRREGRGWRPAAWLRGGAGGRRPGPEEGAAVGPKEER